MYRSKKLLDHMRDCPHCMNCQQPNDETIVGAHSNQLRDGKGRGLKASDYRVAALCYLCHMKLDSGREMSKAERVEMWEEAHRKTVGWLFESGRLMVK